MLGPGHPSDWCPLNPCQGRGQARLRVYVRQAALPSAVVPGSQTGLTANLQGFRIRAPEGWPPSHPSRAWRWSCGATSVRSATSGPTRVGRRRGPAGPKSGRPTTGSVPGPVRCPASYGQSMRCARDSGLVARRFCMCGGQAAWRALRALEDVQKVLTCIRENHGEPESTLGEHYPARSAT